MRSIVALLVLMSLLLLPCAGCGGKPDPRDQEGFIDDPDPAAVMEGMNETPTEGQTP
jgi:hypothetical protein